MESPFVPDISIDNFDQNHVNNLEWKDAEAVKEVELTLKRDSVQALFEAYYFNKYETKAPLPSARLSISHTVSTKATTLANTTENNETLLRGNAGEELDNSDNE